jgi:hypothetical protein
MLLTPALPGSLPWLTSSPVILAVYQQSAVLHGKFFTLSQYVTTQPWSVGSWDKLLTNDHTRRQKQMY